MIYVLQVLNICVPILFKTAIDSYNAKTGSCLKAEELSTLNFVTYGILILLMCNFHCKTMTSLMKDDEDPF